MLKKFLIGTFVALALMVASTAAASYDFGPTTLKVGSSGDYVKTLQTLVGATADGAFGPMTKAKVQVWQAANGLVADGAFGNLSKAKANLGLGGTTSGTSTVAGCTAGAAYSSITGLACAGTTTTVAGCTAGAAYSSTTGLACAGTTTGTTTVVTGVTGTDGIISDVNKLSSYNNEELGEGAKDVKVLGFDAVTTKDGGVAVKSVKVSFDATGNTGSTRLADYLSTVKVLMGSKVIGTANTADFTKDSTGHYSKIITLSDAVIAADATAKFYVSVDAATNLDSGDILNAADSWTLDIENIRYVDGSGVVTTTTDTGDVNGMNVPMSFVSFSTSADTMLKISLNSTPASGIVVVDTDNNTDNVPLLKGKMKLDGTSNVVLNQLPVSFVSAGAVSPLKVTGSVKLTIGTEEFTKTMVSTADGDLLTETIVFDNLDYDMTAGSTVNFTVSADINDLDTDFTLGNSLSASVTTTNRNDMDAENSQGDGLSDTTEKSGTATGEAQYFYEKYAKVESAGTPTIAGVTNNENTATVTFKVKVTAVGGDIYMNGPAETTDADEAFIVATLGGGSGTSTISAKSYTASGATTNGNSVVNAGADNEYYIIAEDQSVTFTVTATITQTGFATTVGAQITSIQFGTSAGAAATNSDTRSLYDLTWAGVTDQFETPQITLIP